MSVKHRTRNGLLTNDPIPRYLEAMSWALYASFKNRDLAERTVGALLDAGVIPEDISLIAPTRESEPHELVVDYEPALMMVDAGMLGTAEVRYRSKSAEVEGSDVYESKIGGGISTSSPDDDVSAIEEMEDAESIAEDLIHPAKGRSFGSEEFGDADAFAKFGTLNQLRRHAHHTIDNIHGSSEISAFVEPGLLILGDGPLALKILEKSLIDHKRTPREVVRNGLWEVGVAPDAAANLAAELTGNGALISVVEAAGQVPIQQIESIIESAGGEHLCTFLIPGSSS